MPQAPAASQHLSAYLRRENWSTTDVSVKVTAAFEGGRREARGRNCRCGVECLISRPSFLLRIIPERNKLLSEKGYIHKVLAAWIMSTRALKSSRRQGRVPPRGQMMFLEIKVKSLLLWLDDT